MLTGPQRRQWVPSFLPGYETPYRHMASTSSTPSVLVCRRIRGQPEVSEPNAMDGWGYASRLPGSPNNSPRQRIYEDFNRDWSRDWSTEPRSLWPGIYSLYQPLDNQRPKDFPWHDEVVEWFNEFVQRANDPPAGLDDPILNPLGVGLRDERYLCLVGPRRMGKSLLVKRMIGDIYFINNTYFPEEHFL